MSFTSRASSDDDEVSPWSGELVHTLHWYDTDLGEKCAVVREIDPATGDTSVEVTSPYLPPSSMSIGPAHVVITHALDYDYHHWLAFDLNLNPLPPFGSTGDQHIVATENQVLSLGYGFLGDWGVGAYSYDGQGRPGGRPRLLVRLGVSIRKKSCGDRATTTQPGGPG